MLEDGSSRIFDILGNRNRRRIIELLRQKPCFVTEISERLTISPKAVIEHLQMMEQEQILRFSLDDRRRKYYYLANDINVIVRIQKNGGEPFSVPSNHRARFFGSLLMLKRMIEARDNLIQNLEHLEKDIETRAQEILTRGKEILEDENDVEIVFALGHYELTYDELQEYTTLTPFELNHHLQELIRQGIIEQSGTRYVLTRTHAE